jgi:flagellin-like hook-associated protein FlgL
MDQGKLWQGGSDVFARVSTFRGDPGQIDQVINYIRESVLPSVRPDESEEAMRATEEEANQLRAEIANAANATIESVETYEVGVSPEQS